MPQTSREVPAEAQKRSRRPSVTDKQLLEKAFDLFVELGFDGASIDAITAQVGIAKRTIYSRYGDKEGLFKASMQHEIERWSPAISVLQGAETEDLAQSLVVIGQMLLDSVLSAQGLRLLRLTGSVASRMPEISAHNVEQGTAPILRFLEDIIHRRLGPRLNCFATSGEAALAFMNLVVGGPAYIVAQGQSWDDQFKARYVESSVHMFLRGLEPQGNERTVASLEDENVRLKKLLAEAMIDLDIARQGTRWQRSANGPVWEERE